MPEARLEGRTAVVTGGGRGIGRAIARRCAAEGAAVALAARSTDALDAVAEEIRTAGGRALAVPTDVREESQVARLAQTVEQEFGPADVLVCNSGIAGPTRVLWEIDRPEWDETIQVNLTGAFLCCRAFLPAMVRQRRGAVVAVGSATGKRPLYGRTPYAASKLGLLGLVRTLAWEAGPHGVRVNLVSPGATEGTRIEQVIRSQAQAKGTSIDAARAELTAASPLDRFVDPAHIAETVVFLASDAAASITGEDCNVTAGMTMY